MGRILLLGTVAASVVAVAAQTSAKAGGFISPRDIITHDARSNPKAAIGETAVRQRSDTKHIVWFSNAQEDLVPVELHGAC